MILKLQTGSDNKILRTKSSKVTNFNDPEIKKLVADMKETLFSMKSTAIGLAAPQIGVNTRIFIISPEIDKNRNVFINPSANRSFKKSLMEEGCLSLPMLYGKVKRSIAVKIEAFDENGKKFKFRATGLLAHIIQHEVDHLDGVLFIDKAQKILKITANNS